MSSTTKPKVYVIGVGMTKFTKPQSTGLDYPDFVKEAVTMALNDCNLKYTDIQQATVGFLYGGTCCGQRALYEVGMTGIPIYNVNNACASGSSGVYLCKQIIESGNADCVLACGFEKMLPGSLEAMSSNPDGRAIAVDKHLEVMSDTYGLFPAPMTCQMFTNAGKEHMEKYGTKREHFAKIAHKNHKHSVHNENSQFRKEFSFDEVMNARKIYDFCGLLECSPTSDGSAAAVLCSEKFLQKHPELKKQAVEIVGLELRTDFPSAFSEKSNIKMIGFDMVQAAAKDLFRNAKMSPSDVQVIECHDCFAANELITYEAIGLCPIGKAGELIDRGDNTYGGKWVVNPSGGLISKGHPIGATGVAQIVELSNQLRGKCGKRQVPNCKVGMQHNIGIGGAVVVGLYRMADGGSSHHDTTKNGNSHHDNNNNNASKPESGTLQSDAIFKEIQARAESEKDLVKNVQASFRITVTDGKTTKAWTINLKKDPPFIGESSEKVDVEINVKDEDFVQMAAGKLKPDQAFMQGKMKLKGNIAKAMKLKSILDPSMLKSKI
jgi:sterol carrier protein 2